MARLYDDMVKAESPIGTVSAAEFLGEDISVNLVNFFPVDGNISGDELLFLSALAHRIKPQTVVEVGTFDGNTTLQLALNTPTETRIFTLDLPAGAQAAAENDSGDASYIVSPRRTKRKFVGSTVEHKIVQRYGNSMDFDFAEFASDGKPQLIFIDAGHSYECVRNDSEKALAILDSGGVIVWQDYSPAWPGVFRYLAELYSNLQMVHITGTTLVVHTRPD